MTATIRNSLRLFNAQTFINSLNTGNSLYLGIGRPEYWNIAQASDLPVPVPFNNVQGDVADWLDMMQLKIISPSYTSLGVFKELWTSGIKYDIYRHDYNGTQASVYSGSNPYNAYIGDLSQAKYYVIEPSSYNLYICIKQNVLNGVVQPSTSSPDTGTAIGTNTNLVQCADGYIWKYVGATSPADYVKFSSDTYHPIKTMTVAPNVADPYYNQWIAQTNSSSFKNGILCINVLNGGTGYNNGGAGTVAFPSTNVTAYGDGTGLAGNIVFGSTGNVVQINITSPGTGYTFIGFTLTNTGAPGTGLVVDPIYTPYYGLGTDPVRDFNAFNALISQILNGVEGGVFTTANDYRKVMLVLNPTNYGTSTISSSVTLDATISLNLTGAGAGYSSDQVVIDSVTGAQGRVVDWLPSSGGSGILRIIRTDNENTSANAVHAFQVGSVVQSGTGVIASITNPTVQPGSGKLIYVEYRAPVVRSSNQTESISVVLEY